MADAILILAGVLIFFAIVFAVMRLILGRTVVDRVAAVDLLHEQLRMRERRDGRGRADQHVHLPEEGEDPLVELGLPHMRARHVAEGQFEAALGVVDDVAIEQVARLFQALAVGRHEMYAAQRLEGLVHAAEVRRPLLHVAEDMAQAADTLLE